MNEGSIKKGLMHIYNVHDFAEEVMKQVIGIHNNFIKQESDTAFFEMGILVESLAQIVREGKK